MFEDSFN